jgi:hypothetical protein
MKKLVWLAVAVLSPGLAGCGSGADSLMKETIGILNDMASALEGVKDDASADAAIPKLKELGAKLKENGNKKLEEKDKAIPQLNQKLEEKYKDKIEKAATRLQTAMVAAAKKAPGKALALLMALACRNLDGSLISSKENGASVLRLTAMSGSRFREVSGGTSGKSCGRTSPTCSPAPGGRVLPTRNQTRSSRLCRLPTGSTAWRRPPDRRPTWGPADCRFGGTRLLGRTTRRKPCGKSPGRTSVGALASCSARRARR